MASVLEDDRLGPRVFRDGKLYVILAPEALRQFEARHVFIKGANAVDPDGRCVCSALCWWDGWRNMGLPLTPRGLHWVAPVSLERFIPSIIEASKHCGNHLWDYTMDQSVGFMPVVNAQVITEIEPLILLTGVTDVHVGSCGVESLVQKGLLCWPLRGTMMLFWLLLS